MTENEYNHAEAFCLMTYQCLTCGTIENIWNSRDGVTPFTVNCRVCKANGVEMTMSKGQMQHVAWDRDLCDPDYLPLPNQRVFVTITKEINEVMTRARVRSQWKRGDKPYRMCDRWESREAAVKALCEDFDEENGEPWVITV